MNTITITTKNGATVSVSITEEQASAFINAEIKKLQDKLNAYKAMDYPKTGQEAIGSLKTKLNKLEEDGKLEASYNYEDLKKRASGASFTGYLTEHGIEKSLHGSANRALQLGKAALAGLKLAKIDDAAILREAAGNAMGGKNAIWREAVLEWLLSGEADA